MAAKTRLYRITSKTGVRLVEATNPQRAISYVARTEFQCDIPTQSEVFGLATAGVKLEVATDEPLSDESRNAVAQTEIPGTSTPINLGAVTGLAPYTAMVNTPPVYGITEEGRAAIRHFSGHDAVADAAA